MPVTVHIPAPLRPECDGESELSVTAETIRGALDQLKDRHPQLYRSVCDETGAVRRHVNLFVNDSLVRRGDGLRDALRPGDTLTIMPAVSGG